MTLLSTLASILATWGVLYVALTGLGLGVTRWASDSPAREVGDAPWVGYAFALLLLQVWHLLLPITALATVLIVMGGWLAAWEFRSAWRPRTWSLPFAASVVVVAAWIAIRSMGELTLFDSGMYHVPFVNWVKAYPIVPGLGNLHGRLGFNPSSLLFAAVTDQGPWTDASQHIVNGFLVAMYAAHALARLAAITPRRPVRPRAMFELTMLPAILVTAMRQDVRSLSTDLPAFVLLAVAGGMLFELLVEREDRSSPASADARFVALLATCGAAVCVKLSAAPFAAAAVLVAMITQRLTLRHRLGHRAFWLPGLLILTWLVRGAVLTGYPLYPSRLLALPVDWRVNAEQADAEAAWITMSARNLNTNTIETSATWLRQWFVMVLSRGDLFAHVLAPVLLSLLAGAAWFVRRRSGGIVWRRAAWLYIPVVLSVLMWWLTAPHTRMAQAAFWVMAATTVSIALGGAPSLTVRRRSALLLGSAVLFAVLAGRIALGELLRSPANGRVVTLIGAVGTLPARDGWLAPMPTPDLLQYLTPSGVDLAVPRVDNSCWNGPLLCTPHPLPQLALRQPGDLSRGFRAPTVWDPLWFPNPWIRFLPYWRCVQRDGGPGTGRRGDRATIEAACRAAAESPAAPAGPQ